MLASQIQLNSLYLAKISGKIVTVRVDSIQPQLRYKGPGKTSTRTVYGVTNLSTGRKTQFNSAAKFRGAAPNNAQNP